ncbi:MAG: hypothetical protein ABEH65_06445 [Halobacteriales archaeon]
MVVPAAGAQMVPATDRSTTDTISTPTATGTGTAAQASDDDSESNYTSLYVEEDYHHLELKPGEEFSFEATVENGEDATVTLDPHVFVPKVGDRPVKSDWVTIEGETTLDPDEETTFTVNVAVPEDAELGRYRGWVAFTNETISYPGRPPRPVHAASFNVEVWKEPTVTIDSDRHIHRQIKAGDSFTRTIEITNTGDQPVPVSPELNMERGHRRAREDTMKREWIDIEAPSEIAPGETGTVEITVSIPESTDRGDYDTEIDLGLKDPARPDRRSHWQQIRMHFQVWKQPEEPYTTSFSVSEDTTTVTLTLDTHNRRYADQSDAKSPSFDVTFVTPNGTEIDAERVQRSERGRVDLGHDNDRRDTADDSAYSVRGSQETFTYRIEEPAAGEWTAEIMPHNAVRFGYEIVRDETDG